MRRPFPTALIGQSSLLREGLAQILGPAGFRVVASVSSVHDLAGSLAHHQSVILIIDSGGDPSAATEQIKLFKEQHPAGRVAVLVDRYRLTDMVSVFQTGANVCFVKTISSNVFIKALELVMLGQTILPPELLSHVRSTNDHDNTLTTRHEPEIALEESAQAGGDYAVRLSSREKCILRYIAEGASNKAIARIMQVAEATVKVHVKAILRKVRVHNRTQAAIWAITNSSLMWTDKAAPRVAAPEAEVGSSQPAALADRGAADDNVVPAMRDGINRKDVSGRATTPRIRSDQPRRDVRVRPLLPRPTLKVAINRPDS